MTIHLHIGEEQIRFTHASAHGPAVIIALGLEQLQREYLPRFPPGEAQLENAIAAVEDALMPHIPQIRQSGQATLACTDAVCVSVARAAGRPPSPTATLHIDDVEQVFNRLALVAAGRPAHHEGLPEDMDFVAALLLLREIMHHAGFGALQVAVH